MIVNVRTTQATGTAERDTAAAMLADLAKGKRVTLGADKGYDTRGLVKTCRELRLTPHVAQNIRRTGGSAIDGRTVRHPGYEVSMRSASPESNSPSSTNAWAGRLGISLGSVAVTTISSAFAGSGLLPPSVRDPPGGNRVEVGPHHRRSNVHRDRAGQGRQETVQDLAGITAAPS